MASSPPAPGHRIGRYELARLLGRGGMGEVWEAVLLGPRGFRKTIALKLLRAGPEDPSAEQALVEEARLGALLQHPNVVATYELGQSDGRWFVAMEIVRGASVRELERQGPLPAAAVVEIGIHTCAGLSHVHGLLVHRDIKPANLLIDRTGLVKIADLGIAWTDGASGIAGTPAYMAPEQAAGRPEPRSDLFSLGATLLALATGTRPFGTGPAALAATRRVDRLLTRGLLDGVEPELATVLERCLRHDPADRWPSASELGAALAALRPALPRGPALVDLLARACPDVGPEPLPSAGSTPSISAAETVVLGRGNLPRAADRFVGRDELAQLVATLREQRLVTLLALGGMGKTRLALEAARTLEPELPGGAWFFDLSEARTVDGLCFAVAEGLSLELTRGEPVEQLGFALRNRGRALFVLDNLEQGVEAFGPVVARWLELAPEATFLGTSRVPLAVRGEHRSTLGPLPQEQAVALLIERSPAALGDPDRPLAAEVCRLLEGMPLAIELAAARTRLMSLAQLRQRLDDRLRILSAGGRELPPRHRSLVAVMEGSWELLTPWARDALAQLSVFDGGFTLEAADAVLDLSRWPEAGWALDVLSELVDASLLHVDPDRGRFSTLVFVHQFAARHLTGEARRAAEARHGACFAQLGSREALAALDGPAGPERRLALTDELDNLVCACRRAVERRDGEVAAATALAASRVLVLRGPLSAAPPLLEAAYALAPTTRRAAVAATMGTLARLLGTGEQILAVLEELRDPAVLVALGALHLDAGRLDEAEHVLSDALRASHAAGDRRFEATALSNLAVLAARHGRRDEAVHRYEQALELNRSGGDREGAGMVLGNLAGEHADAGRFDEAFACYQEALAVQREIGNRRSEGILLGNLGNLELYRGRIAEARQCYEAALDLHRRVGHRGAEGTVLAYLAMLHLRTEHPDEARACLIAARAALSEVGDRRFEGIVLAKLARLEQDAGRDEQALDLLHAGLDATRDTRDARSEGHILCDLAALLARLGRDDEARGHLEEASRVAPRTADAYLAARAASRLALLDAQAGRPVDLAAVDATIEALEAGAFPDELAAIIETRDEVVRLLGARG